MPSRRLDDRHRSRRGFLAASTTAGTYALVHSAVEDATAAETDERGTNASETDAWPMRGATSGQRNANPGSPPITENPTTEWTHTATRAVSAPSVANETVYFTAEDDRLYAVDATTGRERWNARFEAGIGGTPAYADGGLFVCGYDDTVYRVSADTGDVVWEFPLDAPSTVYGAGYGPPSPVVTSDLVFVPTAVGLYAIEPDSGEPRWTRRISSGEKGVLTHPAVEDGRVVVGEWTGAISVEAENAGIRAYDAATGEHLWSNDPETRPDGIDRIRDTPAVTSDAVYVTSERGEVHRLDAATGEFVWTHSLDDDWLASGVTVTDSVGCLHVDESILALDIDTGDVTWRRSIDRLSSSLRPAAGRGRVYTTVGDEVWALDSATGERRWRQPGSSGPYTAVAGGAVYAAGAKSVVAIEAADEDGVQRRQTGTKGNETLVAIGAGLAIVLGNLYAIWRYRGSPEE